MFFGFNRVLSEDSDSSIIFSYNSATAILSRRRNILYNWDLLEGPPCFRYYHFQTSLFVIDKLKLRLLITCTTNCILLARRILYGKLRLYVFASFNMSFPFLHLILFYWGQHLQSLYFCFLDFVVDLSLFAHKVEGGGWSLNLLL